MSFQELLAIYGPAAVPMFGLMLVVKYLLDKDKQRETNHKEETKSLQSRIDILQAELLTEARGNAMLAEELKKALQTLASTGRVN